MSTNELGRDKIDTLPPPHMRSLPVPEKLGLQSFARKEVFRNIFLGLEAENIRNKFLLLDSLLKELEKVAISIRGNWIDIGSGNGKAALHAAYSHGADRVVHIDNSDNAEWQYLLHMRYLLFTNDELTLANYTDGTRNVFDAAIEQSVQAVLAKNFIKDDILTLADLTVEELERRLSISETPAFDGAFLLNPTGITEVIVQSAQLLSRLHKPGTPLILIEDQAELATTVGILARCGYTVRYTFSPKEGLVNAIGTTVKPSDAYVFFKEATL